MPKMTAEAFIEKYGTEGLRTVIGCKTEGCIVRGKDYARIHDLLEVLKDMCPVFVAADELEPEKTAYKIWFDEFYAKTPMERSALPAFSQVVYYAQQEKIDILVASELTMSRSCEHYRAVIREYDKMFAQIHYLVNNKNLFDETQCSRITNLLNGMQRCE